MSRVPGPASFVSSPRLTESEDSITITEQSEKKADLGSCWSNSAGSVFRYYMVFRSANVRLENKILLSDLEDVLNKV